MPGTVFDKPPTVQQKLKASDWQWQLQNRAKTLEQLFALRPDLLGGPLEKEIRGRQKALDGTAHQFRFSVTPYYLSLASRTELDPIWRQILPDEAELSDHRFTQPDPLAEESHMPVPGLTHRYPDRVLWYLSHNCAVYCRFCMRKRKVSRSESAPTLHQRNAALEYIRSNRAISEVILSGGDPLSQSDEILYSILSELKRMDHLSSIRIHTRMPVTCPQRITASFARMLRRLEPITVVTHFNHAQECTEQSARAIRQIRRSGCLVLNQSVLLCGINDSVRAQRDLQHQLLRMGVKPYYLHQCDEVQGVSHFRVNLSRGMELQKELRGRNPGISLPLYVIDLPGGGGKVPVDSSYFVQKSPPEFKNFEGHRFAVHPDIPENSGRLSASQSSPGGESI